MRVFLGMILGAALTVGAAFLHDTMATSSVTGAPGVGEPRTLVNWNVVRSNARGLVAGVRNLDSRVRDGWAKLNAPG